MIKLTKDELIKALHKELMECSVDEIRFVFHVFGFNLKELDSKGGGDTAIDFEIHYKRVYIVRVVVSTNNVLTFENEYVNFGNDTHGIVMGQAETLAETIVVFINMFMPNLLQSAGYEISFKEDMSLFDNLEEAQDYLQTIQDEAQKIINIKHPEPVPAPTSQNAENNETSN